MNPTANQTDMQSPMDGKAKPNTKAEALSSLRQAYTREPGGNPSDLYFATEDGMFLRRPNKGGVMAVRLSNFRAKIVKDVVSDDGMERQRRFMVDAISRGREESVMIAARDFAQMNWVYDLLGPSAIICAGLGIKDHLRAAIQQLSSKITKSRIYAHTGWRQLGSDWFYLHKGGAIGKGGQYKVQVELPPDLSRFRLPDPPEGERLTEAVLASLSILKVGPPGVTFPFYCSIWRSVMGTADCSLHFCGPTGALKTSFSALGQQHFGKEFDRLHLPASWESTENALQALQFFAKDAFLLIDDFAPRGNKSDVERYHHKADRVFRGQGNNTGRARMRPDSSLRVTKSPRGFTVSTGEDAPRGESVKARLMILQLERETIDEARLKGCQDNGAAGLFCEAMAAFLSWVAPRFESIVSEMPSKVATLRDKAARSDQHRRTPDMVAQLMYGLKVFLRFCAEQDILSNEAVRGLREEAWEALGAAATAQAREQRADEPAQRFLDLVSAALTSGEAHLEDARSGSPIRGSSGRCIGWIDPDRKDCILLQPDASLAEAQRLAGQQGENLPVTKLTLWKRLAEKGFLAQSEKGRNLIKWNIREGTMRVLCLRASKLPMAGRWKAA